MARDVDPGFDTGRTGPISPRFRPPQRRRRRQPARQIFRSAFNELRRGLVAGGVDEQAAARYARLVLSRPGVLIGAKHIRYKGKGYKPAAFANTELARRITGQLAAAQNRKAILGEPGYLTDLANLTLQRELTESPLALQRRRAILEFGDPRFAGSDALLGGEASANPYSTSKLIGEAFQRQLGAVGQASNRAGTLFGGGYESGVAEAGRQRVSQEFEATRSLEDLLSSLDRQRADVGRIFDVGKSGALQMATQRLLQSGAIHAAQAPNLRMRRFRIRTGPHRRVTL